MKPSQFLISLLFLAMRVGAADTSSGLVYSPDGDAIVITNGTRWNNRPLYCHERFSLVWSGEMPALQAVLVVEAEGNSAQLPVLSREETSGQPGHRLEIKPFAGAVPRFQLTKVHVPAPANPKLLREAPADATWKTVDLSAVHNGDLREIFKQRYESPRPDRASMRIGYDGWQIVLLP
jgi:hypothetical protein